MIELTMEPVLFENDVRALLMAFYPGEKIKLNQEVAKEERSAALTVAYGEQGISLLLEADGTEHNEQVWNSFCEIVYDIYVKDRNIIKREVYRILSRAGGKELPWGTLTGIRPTKLAVKLIEKGMNRQEAEAYFKREYYISDEKLALCMQVAESEKRLMETMSLKESYSLYIGIPFCPTICAYCSFSSFPYGVWEDQVWDYLKALEKEMIYVAGLMRKKPLLTVYLGGGTPTSLSHEQLDWLLGRLAIYFDLQEIRELTVEAGRPDSITAQKLEVLKRHKVSRISINPQTMNQETLDIIGRRHTVAEISSAFHMARDMGFDNINMDLIVGLPGEKADDVAHTLKKVQALAPDSLTVHSLAIKRAARLNRDGMPHEPAASEVINQMISQSYQAALQMGMEPYYMYRQKNIAGNLENVGYARKGSEGVYNILIMEEKQTIIAMGAGSITKVVFPEERKVGRIENVKNVSDYISRIDEMIARKQRFFEENPETL